jgi:hypothetical protein
MGATTWSYFTPYDNNVDAALQRLRQEVFKDGKYGNGIPATDDMRAMFEQVIAQNPKPALARQQMEEAMARIEQLRDSIPPQPRAETIDELLEQRAESGTHSILDIQRISTTPDFGAVSPLPGEVMEELFGTDKPTRKKVEEKLGEHDLVEHSLVSERWQGIYFTIYRDDKPDELFFMGTSGD